MASFEEQLAELEKVVAQMERGDLPLEDSVSLFERGMSLSEACKAQLAGAESRIHVLLQPREKGPVRSEPFALQEGSEEFGESGEDDDPDADDPDADFPDAKSGR